MFWFNSSLSFDPSAAYFPNVFLLLSMVCLEWHLELHCLDYMYSNTFELDEVIALSKQGEILAMVAGAVRPPHLWSKLLFK